MTTDQNFTNLIANVFSNLFFDIKRKKIATLSSKNNSYSFQKRVIENKSQWLKDLVKWSENERYWFDCAEEFLGWDITNLRKRIKTVALEALLKIETIKPRKSIIKKQLRKVKVKCSHCGEMMIRTNHCKKARCSKCKDSIQKETNRKYREKHKSRPVESYLG